jgi:hypothetical protein
VNEALSYTILVGEAHRSVEHTRDDDVELVDADDSNRCPTTCCKRVDGC